ncbi:hypothetical protein INT48_005924 [Thamnidium elegans]|uniref:Uncharacterized protein n=1 Tax=Thamnidium elegans TaxID=101142 RepID=A0A8H7VWF5_9FUNG|nr:hypothetical protein INT48_005924 [Thamnidium elegans]
MQDLESNKDERRRILGSLQDWNVGITPVGKLATESCFVHNSVPDILYETHNRLESLFTSTRSEWTTNLVQSNTSNPRDIETMKSLSVCKSIFHKPSSKTDAIHLIEYNLKAYVMVNNIARLTKDFEDELTKAEEHWPHSPQKSWDKLCQIWNRYGFLWPQKVGIGFKMHYSYINHSNLDIKVVKDLLRKESQDVLQSPKNYSVIWRTSLMPVHEFFPSQYDKKRNFINNIIRKFSNVMFSDSLFRLKNVKSGDYLGRHTTEALQVTTLLLPDKKVLNNSNFFWSFNSTELPHYIFTGNKKLLCSGQLDTTKTIILSKLQYNHFDRNNPQARDNIKLIEYKQSDGQQTSSNDTDNYFQWTIDIFNRSLKDNSSSSSSNIFDLDQSIEQVRCLLHDDEIILHQNSFYLKIIRKDSIFKPNSIDNISPVLPEAIKSPLSTFSFGDQQFNFSSCESSGTQPTSRSNSFHSAGSINKQDFHQSIALIERLKDKTHIPPEYCWKLEMVSKTLLEDGDMINVVKSLSKSNISGDQNSPKPYHPDLNYNSSPFRSPESHIEHKNQALLLQNNIINISSFIPVQDHTESTNHLKNQFWHSKTQKSKWLNVDPKLYNLSSQTEDEIIGSVISTYSTSTESIRSIHSPSNPYLPEVSEKRFGKQPLQTAAKKQNVHYSSSGSDQWSSPASPSVIDKNNDIDFNTQNYHTSSVLTEAENIKRGYQESHKEKEINAYNRILQNMFNASPNSNNTSQIKYYDEDGEEEEDAYDYGSSQVYTYTMTPYSRFSQQMTPSSSANLTPEEYMRRKKSRENSFMLLIDRETKQEFWLRTVKQSSLSNWLQFLSTNTKKLK